MFFFQYLQYAFLRWAEGEPADNGNCANIQPNGGEKPAQWMTSGCTEKKPFVCKVSARIIYLICHYGMFL